MNWKSWKVLSDDSITTSLQLNTQDLIIKWWSRKLFWRPHHFISAFTMFLFLSWSLMFMVMIWECAELMMAWTVSWGSLSSDTDWPHSSSQPGCPPSPGRASLWGRCRGDWWGWSTLPGWRAWRAWRRSSVWRRWPASTVRSFYNVLVLGNHLPAPSYDRVNLLSGAQLVALQSDTWLGWCWWSVAEFSINQITENTERCCHWKLLRLHNFEMRLDKLWKV